MRSRFVGMLVGAAVLVASLGQPAWAAGSASFAGKFGAGPVGTSGNYFALSVPPGGHATGTVRIWSTARRPLTLDVEPAEGVESPNSGDAYSAGASCGGAACWLGGLPGTVTLAPGVSRNVAFTVQVPPGVVPGQYLAGVQISPAARPSTSAGGVANSAIVSVVDVGVAISVGTGWSSDMAIAKVAGVDIGDRFGVAITETNHGTEWEHPAGTATVDGITVPVKSGTLLPGSSATLRVVVPGATPGSWPSQVTLHYASTKVATWNGDVAIPAAAAAPTLPTSRHGKILSAVPAGAAATAAVIGAVAGVLVVMLAVLVVLWRRRRTPRSSESSQTLPSVPVSTQPWPSAAEVWPSAHSPADPAAPPTGKRRPRPQADDRPIVGGRR